MARPSAREKLLDSAEILFAAHGVGGVSLRAINADAGLSPAALHYHFGHFGSGTQRVLVEALLERRMPSLMARRKNLLDALESRAGAIRARQVVDALLRPLAELLAEGGEAGLRYLRLLHRLRADGDLDARFVVERFPGGVERLVPLLRQALPDLPVAVVELRLGLAIDVMLQSLAQGPRLSDTGRDASIQAHTDALLDFLTGAFEAPVTPITPPPTPTPGEPV